MQYTFNPIIRTLPIIIVIYQLEYFILQMFNAFISQPLFIDLL